MDSTQDFFNPTTSSYKTYFPCRTSVSTLSFLSKTCIVMGLQSLDLSDPFRQGTLWLVRPLPVPYPISIYTSSI